jgi:hypothetical protein
MKHRRHLVLSHVLQRAHKSGVIGLAVAERDA